MADEISDFIRESKHNAVQMSPQNWGQTDKTFYQFLDKEIEGKRVVFLGESAHWIQEKYDYRLVLLQYLMGKGFKTIGMEMGLSDGSKIDHYLQTGDVSFLNQVALYGYRNSHIRARPSVSSCGEADRTNLEFPHTFATSEKKFYSELYNMAALQGSENQLRHFGFDLDTAPGGGYEDVVRILRFKKSPEVVALQALIALIKNESLSDEAERLAKALSFLEQSKPQLTTELGRAQYEKLKTKLTVLAASFKFLAIFASKPCDATKTAEWSKNLMTAMAEREKIMFAVLKEKLKELGPDEKIVLMGHNFHLSKDPASLWFSPATVPAPSAPVMWPSIGQFVTQTLSLPTFSIWMIHNRGTQSNIHCPSLDCPVEARPGYLGDTLSKIGEAFILPFSKMPSTAAKYLNQRLSFGVNGGTYSGVVSKNADLIFFVNQVHGLGENHGEIIERK